MTMSPAKRRYCIHRPNRRRKKRCSRTRPPLRRIDCGRAQGREGEPESISPPHCERTTHLPRVEAHIVRLDLKHEEDGRAERAEGVRPGRLVVVSPERHLVVARAAWALRTEVGVPSPRVRVAKRGACAEGRDGCAALVALVGCRRRRRRGRRGTGCGRWRPAGLRRVEVGRLGVWGQWARSVECGPSRGCEWGLTRSGVWRGDGEKRRTGSKIERRGRGHWRKPSRSRATVPGSVASARG